MKTNDSESVFCGMPHCRGLTALQYLGKPMCFKCWKARCEAETERERVAYNAKHVNVEKANRL